MKVFDMRTLLAMTLMMCALCSAVYANEVVSFHPIEHATFVIQSGGYTIYVDPVGEASAFAEFPHPDLILITDIHYDHFEPGLVNDLKDSQTLVVGAPEVIMALGSGVPLANGEDSACGSMHIEAIPAYNVTEHRTKYHEKGRGNGYLITVSGKRVYISGDTEDIPEMRALTNIDYALVCMNLPYTMTVEQAADAVLAFKPKVVIPYHFRGVPQMSDLEKFKALVTKDPSIEVRVLKWY